jgi:hypothetical protein
MGDRDQVPPRGHLIAAHANRYTAWSRPRRGTRFYAVEPEISDEHHTAAPVDTDRFEELVRRLDRSEAQRAALDALPEGPPAARHTAAAKHANIVYLERALGSRPDSFRPRRRWDRAARQVERYRARHCVSDPADALGPEPADRAKRLAWRKAQRDLARHQIHLGRVVPGDDRSRAIGR